MPSNRDRSIPSMQMKPRLLMVDDELLNIRIMYELFRQDFELFMANDGASAIDKARELTPDLILLDIVMPGIDGYQVCTVIKSDPVLRDIPIIFLTANNQQQEEVKGFEIGAVDFIRKPFHPVITKARVLTHLKLKQQSDALRDIALTDGLTGLANRRKFDSELLTDWVHCAREMAPLSLLMIDIDHFKKYNDFYGHLQGDSCLRQVAHVFKETMGRPYDLAARYGGEEFACLLPHTNGAGAIHIAQELLNGIAVLELAHEHPDVSGQVTISIGIASTVPVKDVETESLIKMADHQLYLAKKHGRAQYSACGVSSLSNDIP